MFRAKKKKRAYEWDGGGYSQEDVVLWAMKGQPLQKKAEGTPTKLPTTYTAMSETVYLSQPGAPAGLTTPRSDS